MGNYENAGYTFGENGISVPSGYVLMKVIAYDQWGGLPTTEPVLYGETKEELEEFCDDHGYEYTGSWPRYIIESMEEINRRQKEEADKRWRQEHPSVLSIDLIGIPYVEMLHIFNMEDPKILEAYIYFRHILKNPEYKNFKFLIKKDDSRIITLMEVIRKQQVKLSITISPEDFSRVLIDCSHLSYIQQGGYNIVKEGLYNIFTDYITSLNDPATGLKTYYGIINKAIPMKMNMIENELFRFKITDTSGNEYYFEGTIHSLANKMDGDMDVEFIIQEVPTNMMEIIN